MGGVNLGICLVIWKYAILFTCSQSSIEALRNAYVWFAGIILVVISFPFIFAPCISCGESGLPKLVYYAPFIAIFQIGWASTQISHLALIPKMHPDELVRTELLAIR